MSPAAHCLLEAEGLVKRFPVSGTRLAVQAVHDVGFRLDAGEVIALVGESGSGKSTLGRLVLRLTAPTAGAVRFKGQDITHLPEGRLRRLRADMTMVFQDPWGSLNPRLKVGTLIGEPLLLHERSSRAERYERVVALAQRVRLSAELLGRYPSELSGGQLQRVSIARAMATRPSLIVLDEPTSSLDLSVRAEILELLAELRRDSGAAMLFITHDLGTVRLIADRILVMYLGTVVESGPAQTVFAAPAHPYTQALLSAHLSADPGVRHRRHTLAGEIPSPLEPPPGCPFSSRCPVVRADCRDALPAALPATPDGTQRARCVRVADGSNRLADPTPAPALAQT